MAQVNIHAASVPELPDFGPGTMLAPHIDWATLTEAGHFAQFYETDDFLLHGLREFIGAGLRAGDAALVVATPEHRAGLADRLQAAGTSFVIEPHIRFQGQPGEQATMFLLDPLRNGRD